MIKEHLRNSSRAFFGLLLLFWAVNLWTQVNALPPNAGKGANAILGCAG